MVSLSFAGDLVIVVGRLSIPTRAIPHGSALQRESFGDIFERVRKAGGEVLRLEDLFDRDPSEPNLLALQEAWTGLRNLLMIEEGFWRQKARVKWIWEGDKNSKYFHSLVAERRAKTVIHRIKGAVGDWIAEDNRIASEAVEYFKALFSAKPSSGSWDTLDVIPHMISHTQNEDLMRVLEMEEIREVVFGMDGESAAGLDDFTGKFFTFAWEVVAEDVCEAVVSFFCGQELPKSFMATWVVLIPKVSSPQEFSQFRPISLCNFLNKMISKILANRLAKVLPNIISPQQSGFVQGRQIFDNVLLAQELIAGIRKASREGNVVLKIDMAKAYDRVSWPFLIQVLRRFGFCEVWIEIIWRLISNVWFSVVVNGAPQGFFKSSRGIRQEDPLSLGLFVLRAEVLSRHLNSLSGRQGFIPFRVPMGCPIITHLAYANDIIIFSSGMKKSLQLVMQVLENYTSISGQKVNHQKSGFLSHASLSDLRKRIIAQVTGFCFQSFPVTYLGCPLYSGRWRKSYFSAICTSVASRVLSWKERLLSSGGKLVLVWSILASMPIHILAASNPPRGVFVMLEQIFADFLWGSSEVGPQFHWIKWSQLCKPYEEGGVGIRLRRSLWAEFMHLKYCPEVHPCFSNFLPGHSHTWKRMVHTQVVAEKHICWSLGSGSSSFWHDNWLGTGPLCRQVESFQEHSVADFVMEGRWDLQSLSRVLSPGWVQQGEVARQVWGCFEDLIGGFSGVFTVRHRVMSWWAKPTINSYLGFVLCTLPSLICWNLWKMRNRWIFKGKLDSVMHVCDRIFLELRECFCVQFREISLPCTSRIGFFETIARLRSNVIIREVCWVCLTQSLVKLNADGCSRGNPGRNGGGGLFRDCDGRFLLGFSCYFGEATSLQAEMKALFFGVRLGVSRGLGKLHLESNSLVLVRIIQGTVRCPWRLQRELLELQQYRRYFEAVSHCFLEANKLADRLSNVGVEARCTTIYEAYNALPRYLRIWARGIWYVAGFPIRIFKWSPAFHIDKEPSVVPVWFQLPKLPLHYFHKEAIFQIVSVLGVPLFVDAATLTTPRPCLVRVCVEIDLLQSRASRVWVGNGKYEGFWQSFIPENTPKYCFHCYWQGDDIEGYHVLKLELRLSRAEKPHQRVKDASQVLEIAGMQGAESWQPLSGAREGMPSTIAEQGATAEADGVGGKQPAGGLRERETLVHGECKLGA
ncbi:uncharacterized protein [Coffea arabica]|uniref:Reverse transcriptase domain-containing protein n=1 Tax=Coffea arabica TaxID=13443 RepID=A0ABM4UYP6_COFAR